MKENLLSAIKAHDFNAIRNICFGLSEEERLKLKVFFLDTPITQMYDMPKSWAKNVPNDAIVMAYAFMCLSDQREEILHFERKNNICPWYAKGVFYDFLSTAFYPELLALIQAPQGAYLKEELPQMYRENAEYISFEMLWVLYKMDLIPFNEKLFVKNFYHKNVSYREELFFIDLLLQYPEIATQILAAAPKYIYTYLYDTEYILAMYQILAKNNYFTNRDIVKQYLEALLNPWKKNILNAYCRWIEVINPTADEVIENQYTFFSLLSLGNTALINFAMKQLQKAANASAFDFQSFADNFALCFTTQKIAKSQLIGVEILEKYYKKQAPTNPDYREQLAVLFTVPDAQLQEKVANLLTIYFNHEGLPEVIAPYRDYLKGKAQDLLATLSPSENSENSQTARAARTSHTSHTALTLTPVSCTPTPEKLLFLLGNCLRERTAATIDLFFEGLVQLQDQLPENFKEQLAPYIPQVNGMYYFNVQLAALQLLLAGWVEDRPLESPEEWKKMNAQVRRLNTEEEEPFKQACVLHNVWYLRDEIPYLLYKVKATLNKLKSGSKLPFLSTPTHAPFYMDAETLADRLLAYQTAGKEVDLDDLVVACNRLLLSTITPEAQEKVRSLSGQYAPALGYLFGLSDVVTPTEELLPLWTQITRLKHPNKVFTEFEATVAKDYLSAVKPFFPSYEIEGEFKQFFLEKVYVDDYYNYTLASPFDSSVFDRLPYNCYNAGAYDRWDTDTLRYVISLNPQYVDVLLGKYTPLYVGDSDAETQRNLREPLQLLLEYDLPVHHGGWIFVGMALLHDKKETRDLAAEYILCAISHDEDLSYLQHFLADILAQKLTPINRFVEFLDMPTRDPKIKAFQKAVVEAYLPLAEKQEKKPTNHKKLANWLIS